MVLVLCSTKVSLNFFKTSVISVFLFQLGRYLMQVVTGDLIQFKPSLIKSWQVTRLSLCVFQCSSFTICYIILIVLLNSDNELIFVRKNFPPFSGGEFCSFY